MRKVLQMPLNRTRYAISIAKRFRHNETTSHPVERLIDRSVVRATGQDVCSYLQGLTTADIYQLDVKPIVYTMFLNSKGRILFDAFLHKSSEGVLIECHKDVSNKLLSHLNLFKVRRKINLTVDNGIKVLVGDLRDRDGVDDPRTPLLGQRAVSSDDAPSSRNYTLTRYGLGLAEGPAEIPIGACFPLEYNLEWLNGVSFDKGCYIGQELTARTYHTGVVRKRIMPLKLAEPNDEVCHGDSIVDVETGKSVGSVRGTIEGRVLALMRVKEALASKHLQVRNTDVYVTVPDWWPKDFYK